jgi:hypothetical protein
MNVAPLFLQAYKANRWQPTVRNTSTCCFIELHSRLIYQATNSALRRRCFFSIYIYYRNVPEAWRECAPPVWSITCLAFPPTHTSLWLKTQKRERVFVFLLSALSAYTIMLPRQQPADYKWSCARLSCGRCGGRERERGNFLCSLGVSMSGVRNAAYFHSCVIRAERARVIRTKSKLAAPLFVVLNKLELCYGQNAFSTSLWDDGAQFSRPLPVILQLARLAFCSDKPYNYKVLIFAQQHNLGQIVCCTAVSKEHVHDLNKCKSHNYTFFLRFI